MREIILLICLAVGACAADEPSSDVIGADEELVLVEPESVPELYEVPDTEAPEAEDGGMADLETLTTDELHELYFGDSAWDCCAAWPLPVSENCENVVGPMCDDNETPATNGLTYCCVPDIGQCAYDADGGL